MEDNRPAEPAESQGVERAQPVEPKEKAMNEEQTLENGGLTEDDAHDIVYGKGEFAAAQPVEGPREQDTNTPSLCTEVPCLDCGRHYPHGLDMILTKKQWRMVNPDDGGVLCPSCIVNRAERLPDSISVYAHIAFISDHDEPTDSMERILVALRLENADYCRETLEARHRIEELEAAAPVEGVEREWKQILVNSQCMRCASWKDVRQAYRNGEYGSEALCGECRATKPVERVTDDAPARVEPEKCPYCGEPILDEEEDGGYTHMSLAAALKCPNKYLPAQPAKHADDTNSKEEIPMKHEVIEDRNQPGDYRVEAIDATNDGEVFTAIFVGPDAQIRAEEYAQWKNK